MVCSSSPAASSCLQNNLDTLESHLVNQRLNPSLDGQSQAQEFPLGDGEVSPLGGTDEMCENSQFGTFGIQFYFIF